MKILFVTSEMSPLARTGGLGDVLGSLPAAIRKKNHDVRVIMPLYKKIKMEYGEDLRFLRWSIINIGWRNMYSGLFTMDVKGVPVYFIDNEFYFGHDNIYLEYTFDIERFSFFQRAVLEVLGEPMQYTPDVLHLNDWQSAMIPLLLKEHYQSVGYLTEVKTVLTIHNLKFQGVHGVEQVQDFLDLPGSIIAQEAVLHQGAPNFLKTGINYSDAVTAVSPSYAREIMTDFYGEGLNGVLGGNYKKLTGILNGVDTDLYNPVTDKNLERNYGTNNRKMGKAACKKALETELGFEHKRSVPIAAMITRLTYQKGIDLLLHVADEMMQTVDMRLVILGTGEPEYEFRLRELANRYPDKVRTLIEFNFEKAQHLYAGADLFLMPSVFEPCGLSQMIAMRYGTLPVVRQTGGLMDTVQPYNQYDGSGNGFGFMNINAHELLFTVKKAVALYNDNKNAWHKLVLNAMKGDYSWEKSAETYVSLYRKVTGRLEECC